MTKLGKKKQKRCEEIGRRKYEYCLEGTGLGWGVATCYWHRQPEGREGARDYVDFFHGKVVGRDSIGYPKQTNPQRGAE